MRATLRQIRGPAATIMVVGVSVLLAWLAASAALSRTASAQLPVDLASLLQADYGEDEQPKIIPALDGAIIEEIQQEKQRPTTVDEVSEQSFAPIFLLSLVGLVTAFRRSSAQGHPIHRYLAVLLVLYWLLISTFSKWWGGGSFGPRLFAEMWPVLVLLLIPAYESLRSSSSRVRWAGWSLAALLTLCSLFVAVHGATSPGPRAWNSTPDRVGRHLHRLWDWSDMQIFRR